MRSAKARCSSPGGPGERARRSTSECGQVTRRAQPPVARSGVPGGGAAAERATSRARAAHSARQAAHPPRAPGAPAAAASSSRLPLLPLLIERRVKAAEYIAAPARRMLIPTPMAEIEIGPLADRLTDEELKELAAKLEKIGAPKFNADQD